MKKILLILLCLPMIGFGQDGVTHILMDSKGTIYYPNGKAKIIVRDSILNGIYKGLVRHQYHENGKTSYYRYYIKQDKRGQPKATDYYGTPTGHTTYFVLTYHKNGNLKSLEAYTSPPRKDYQMTRFKEWSMDGRLQFHDTKTNIAPSLANLLKLESVVPFGKKIKRYVKNKINSWNEKGEFEMTIDYHNRVNENSRKEMKEKYRKEAIEHFKKEAINSIGSKDISLKEYNADMQTFLINISGYGNFNLPVPISKAPSFKQNFNVSNFSNLDLILEDDKFIVSHFEIDGYIYDLSYNKCIGDCQNGYGTYTSQEGTYKGHWKDGSVHGKGIFEGNEYTYDGEYVNGKQHGQGKKTYTNGTIEEGLFENGVFIGE